MFSKSVMSGIFTAVLMVPAIYGQQLPAPPTETIKTAATHTPENSRFLIFSR